MKKSKGLSLRENADSTKRESAPPAHENLLGSTAINSDPSGNPMGDMLFYPWGQVWPVGISNSLETHWAAFQARGGDINGTLFRVYEDNYGRWLTPDPLGGDITNPQSLNRYAYVMNNPTTLTDPLGLQSGDFDPRACQDPAYADSHAECEGPGSDYCSQFPYSPECSGYPGGGIGGVGGGNRPAPPGAPPAGQPPLAGGGSAYWPLGCPFPYNSMGLCGLSPDLWTGQVGISANYTLPWGLSGTFFFGLAIDLHGRVGLYYGGGGGVGKGAGGSVGVQFGQSNAYNVCGLRGPFLNASGTFGAEGVGGTVDVFQGSGPGPGGTVTGGTVTIGAEGGAGASLTGTGTKVIPLHGGPCPPS